jgi:hypothetical protein
MVNTNPKTLGGKPKQVAASSVSCGRYPPPEGHISHPVKAHSAGAGVRWTVLWGT